jgi:hypothetical protein
MKTLSSLLPLLATIPLAAPALAGDLSLDLYAGQHELIGQVLVCDDGSDLFVTYDAEGGAVMSTTHLYASLDAPKKHSPGRFGYKNEGISSQVDEYSISLSELGASAGDTLYLAAHADTELIVGYEEPVLELAPEIPDTVTITSTHSSSGPNYWTTTVTNGGDLDGTYAGWCVDTSRTMSPGASYTAAVYSSYEAAAAGLVDSPEALDNVNWLINQDLVGQPSPGCGGTYTSSDLQRSIWTLVETTNSTAGLGSWSQCRVNELVAAANASGEGFTPGCMEQMLVILVPINANGVPNSQIIVAQVTVIEVDLECAPILNGQETAWAAGNYAFRQSWASYFDYEVGSATCD